MPERLNICLLFDRVSMSRTEALVCLPRHSPLPASAPSSVLIQRPEAGQWEEYSWESARERLSAGPLPHELFTVYFLLGQAERLSATIERDRLESWTISFPGQSVLAVGIEPIAAAIHGWAARLLGPADLFAGPELEVSAHTGSTLLETINSALSSEMVTFALVRRAHLERVPGRLEVQEPAADVVMLRARNGD